MMRKRMISLLLNLPQPIPNQPGKPQQLTTSGKHTCILMILQSHDQQNLERIENKNFRARRLAKLTQAPARQEPVQNQPKEKILKPNPTTVQPTPNPPCPTSPVVQSPVKKATRLRATSDLESMEAPMTIIKDIFNISYEPKLDENSSDEKISEIVSTIIAKTLYNFTTAENGTSKDDFDNFYTIPTSQHANMIHFLIKIYQKCSIMIKVGFYVVQGALGHHWSM